MANGTNINLLCDELEKLLKDICTFLHDETIDKIFPQPRKLKAELLLERSNKQLESLRGINKICTGWSSLKTHATTNCSRAIVHRCEDQESIYINTSELEELSLYKDCEFANEVENGKSGPLLFHKKTFFFEKTKKVFIAIFRHWFVIYSNKSASKPLHVINLMKYESSACVDLPYNVKKKENSFDVIPINGSKYFRFTADSPRDMLEWVTAINRSRSYEKYKPSPISTLTRHPHCSLASKKNKTRASQQSTLGYHLHEAQSRRSLGSSDDGMYITVIEGCSTDSFSAEENDKMYDTLERINKRTLRLHRREEKRKNEEDQNEYNGLLVNNCKLVAMDVGSYWENKEKSRTNKY